METATIKDFWQAHPCGAELVGGQGGPAPRFAFATLYRLRGWRDGGFREVLEAGRMIAAGGGLEDVFPANGTEH